MGISGLHQCLKPFAEKTHVREYEGSLLAIDMSSWLYRGAAPVIEGVDGWFIVWYIRDVC